MKIKKPITILNHHAEILLRDNYVVLFDLDDVEKLSKIGWVLKDSQNRLYVHGSFGKKEDRKTVMMHRYILNAPKGIAVDHINGNGLDNRKINLRFATPQQNSANSKKSKRNTSKYKGVHKRENGKWRASIRVNQKLINIGTFTDEIEAAKAYNEKAFLYFGGFACLNKLP